MATANINRSDRLRLIDWVALAIWTAPIAFAFFLDFAGGVL